MEALATISQKVAHAIVSAARGTAAGTGDVGVHVKDVELAQEAELWSFQHDHIVEGDHALVVEDKPAIVLRGGKDDFRVVCFVNQLVHFKT